MTLVKLKKTVVTRTAAGTRRIFACPECGQGGRKLNSFETYEAGVYPAPQVEIRRCHGCGCLHEFDRWSDDRAFWRGVA